MNLTLNPAIQPQVYTPADVARIEKEIDEQSSNATGLRGQLEAYVKSATNGPIKFALTILMTSSDAAACASATQDLKVRSGLDQIIDVYFSYRHSIEKVIALQDSLAAAKQFSRHKEALSFEEQFVQSLVEAPDSIPTTDLLKAMEIDEPLPTAIFPTLQAMADESGRPTPNSYRDCARMLIEKRAATLSKKGKR
jgi:hypothetical protein